MPGMMLGVGAHEIRSLSCPVKSSSLSSGVSRNSENLSFLQGLPHCWVMEPLTMGVFCKDQPELLAESSFPTSSTLGIPVPKMAPRYRRKLMSSSDRPGFDTQFTTYNYAILGKLQSLQPSAMLPFPWKSDFEMSKQANNKGS